MIRHVKDDLYQVGEYVSGSWGTEAVQVYVLLNDGRPILIDCGSHLHRHSVMADLDHLLDGRTPSHIFLTHSELPHAGNLAAVAEKWPKIEVLVSIMMLPYIEVLPVLPLTQITQIAPGTRLEFPSRTLEFVDALLKDQPGSQWIYDSRTETLFTGDGFGFYQPAEQMTLFSDELSDGVKLEAFIAYHRSAFRFLRWIDPDRFNMDLDRMFAKRDISVVAPIHGNAIRSDILIHLERVKQAVADIAAGYRSETI